MNRILILSGLITISSILPVRSAQADLDFEVLCSDKSLAAARRTAEAAYRSKNLAKAIKTLEEKAVCSDEGKQAYWLKSDLGLYYLKAGKYVECQRELGSLLYPSNQFDGERGSKVDQAIKHNFELCGKKKIAELTFVSHTAKCQLKANTETQAAVSLLKEMIPAHFEEACLALTKSQVPDERSEEGESYNRSCPSLLLIGKDRSSKKTITTRLRIEKKVADGGPLIDSSVCCNLTEVSVGEKDLHRFVRVHGTGRDCDGGVALADTDALYRWSPESATLDRDMSTPLN